MADVDYEGFQGDELRLDVQKVLEREAAAANISMDLLERSSDHNSLADYAKYYSDQNRIRGVGHVALRFQMNPEDTLDFELKAGSSERDRDFSNMIDNLGGYCRVLAETAYARGYVLKPFLKLNGRITSFSRSRSHQDAFPEKPEMETKYLLIEEQPGTIGIYNGPVLVGYNMQAHLVDSEPKGK